MSSVFFIVIVCSVAGNFPACLLSSVPSHQIKKYMLRVDEAAEWVFLEAGEYWLYMLLTTGLDIISPELVGRQNKHVIAPLRSMRLTSNAWIH